MHTHSPRLRFPHPSLQTQYHLLQAYATASALLSLEAGIAHERCLGVKIVDFKRVLIVKVFFCTSRDLNSRPLYKGPYHFMQTEALPI